MRRILLLSACGGLACALGVSACGVRSADGNPTPASLAPAAAASRASTPAVDASCPNGSGFSLSLVSDRGGRPTPVAAAYWFARHGGVPAIPLTGWRQVSRSGATAFVRSGDVTLHVIQGPDRTWQVDSGETCG